MAWTTQTAILPGINALGTMLDSVDTNVSAVLSALGDSTNGLAAIKAAAGGDDSNITAIKNHIESASYGLARIKEILVGPES